MLLATQAARAGASPGGPLDANSARRDVVVKSEPAAHHAFDRAVRIAEAEPAGEVHVGRPRQPVVEKAERRVVFRADQAVDDTPRPVGGNHDRQPRLLEHRPRRFEGAFVRLGLAHQLDQIGWRIVPVPVAREADCVGALLPRRLAGVDAEALGAELDQDRGLRRVGFIGRPKQNDDLRIRRRGGKERIAGGKGPALAVLADRIGHRHAPNIRVLS